jgi:DHA2 family multidrug resistance protein
LPVYFRTEGTALFSLVRNIGSSIGISVVITYLSQHTQMNHAAYSEYISPFNPAVKMALDTGSMDISSSLGLSMIDQAVTAQAATLAYMQDFRLMMWITLAAIPLLVLLKAPARRGAVEKVEAVLD